jgi:hypothetical protein
VVHARLTMPNVSCFPPAVITSRVPSSPTVWTQGAHERAAPTATLLPPASTFCPPPPSASLHLPPASTIRQPPPSARHTPANTHTQAFSTYGRKHPRLADHLSLSLNLNFKLNFNVNCNSNFNCKLEQPQFQPEHQPHGLDCDLNLNLNSNSNSGKRGSTAAAEATGVGMVVYILCGTIGM